MKITPVPPIYNSVERKPMPHARALKRYEYVSQTLFDALTAFVDAYEEQADMAADNKLTGEHPKVLLVSLGDIRRAQAALRYVATDILA